ncbi:MAG: hypothetical protein H7263_04985, partial [Candidatus Sericytochromatia bacterium]|nr:hypothetical protein [Candidatus Sericytochromatia bacterium]
NPTLPSLYDFNMDSEIEKIILKCLDKNPENRFSSLSELKNELSKYYESRFVSNKFINSFFKLDRQDIEQISHFNSSIKVDLQKEDEVIQFKNFSNLSLIKSLTDRYDKKLFDSFNEFDKYLQTDEKFGFIFSKNRVFFVHKSIILSGFDSLNNIEIFNNVEMEDLQFLEAIVAKDFLIPIYFYNVLFYKADNNVEIEDINTLEHLNNHVLENNLNNSVIKFKSNNLPENYLKKKILYLGNNIINYLFIKFFVNDFIFERKFNLIDIVLDEFDLILYDYSPEKSDYNIFNYLIQSGKEFLVIANNSFYEEAKESFQNKDIFSFSSLNRELLSFIKENTNLIMKNTSVESSSELYAFYQANILTNLVLDYKNRLKLFKYQDEDFNITSIKNIDLIMSKITNISSLVNEIIPTLEKTLVNKIDNEILINLYYHKENSYTLANIIKTEEYAYSHNLKDKIIDNLNFDHNKVNLDNDTLKLYNYSKFVIENFFFDMIAKNKYNNFPLLLDLISKISRIKINTKFKGQYQSELNIPILIESNDNGIIIVDTGDGSQDDLLRVSEISKHLVNNLKQKVVSTFYICNNNYPSNSIDFYRQEIKAPKIAFFDKLAKIKNIVRLENDKYFHFILVKDENDIMQCLEIY